MRRFRQVGIFQGVDLTDGVDALGADGLPLQQLLELGYHPDTPRVTYDPLSDPLNDPFPEELR